MKKKCGAAAQQRLLISFMPVMVALGPIYCQSNKNIAGCQYKKKLRLGLEVEKKTLNEYQNWNENNIEKYYGWRVELIIAYAWPCPLPASSPPPFLFSFSPLPTISSSLPSPFLPPSSPSLVPPPSSPLPHSLRFSISCAGISGIFCIGSGIVEYRLIIAAYI